MNLLIINDNIFEAQTMKEEIRWEQYGIDQVLLAYNAGEAYEIIQKGTIDIALCDIEMPGENGLSLIRRIRSAGHDIDCILLTAHADFSYAQEAVSLNCIEYILLPARYETIGKTVCETVQKRQKRLADQELQKYGESFFRLQNAPDAASVSRPVNAAEIVSQSQKYIIDHLDEEDMTIAVIASQFFISSIYLSRIFKKETGVSINQWIIQEKMKAAAHMLRTTDYPAALVAERVGYSNYPYFSTVFKKYYGCSPSQYAKETADQ